MNITSVKKVMPVLLKHNLVPFLWGHKGIGKTEVVKQIADALGIGFVPLYLGTCSDVGDIIGNTTIMNGATHHMRPSWFPTEGKGIIFLDEFNRMHPDIAQAMFSFVQLKRLYTHVLPPGWMIVAAGNPDTDGYMTNSIADDALLSRFVQLAMVPTAEEFANYARSKGANLLASFVLTHPELTSCGSSKGLDINAKGDNRALLGSLWPLESETIFTDNERFEIYQGCVGRDTALAFLEFKKKSTERVTLAGILNNYPNLKSTILSNNLTEIDYARIKLPISEIAGLKELTDAQFGNLMDFLVDIPLELLDTALISIDTLDPPLIRRIKHNKRLADRYAV